MANLYLEFKNALTDKTCSLDSNLEHLLHWMEGYRTVIVIHCGTEPEDEIEDDPYSPGGARAISFAAGKKQAMRDLNIKKLKYKNIKK